MSLTRTQPQYIEIYGLLTSYPFQITKKYAKVLHAYYPRRFHAPKCNGMLECAWHEYIAKQRRKHGGELLWSLQRTVVVFVNKTLIGSDVHFLKLVNTFTSLSSNDVSQCRDAAMLDYRQHMQSSRRWYVYLDIKIDEQPIGLLVFQLYSDLLPKTCRNFRCLCSGERGTTKQGISLGYRNTEIHRICKGGWIQGGDIVNIKGGGGMSVYGATFHDESYCIGHDRRGVLAMANDGRHTNASQFLVTLQAMPWMNGRYVAFGQLVEGSEVLQAIENVDTFYERPLKCIKICDSGIWFEPETEADLKAKQLAAEQCRQSDASEPDAEPVSDHGDSSDRGVNIPDVLDDRDLESEMCLQRYLDGLYSLETPDFTYGFGFILDDLMDNIFACVRDDMGDYRRNLKNHPKYLAVKAEAEIFIDSLLEQATTNVLEILSDRAGSLSRYTEEPSFMAEGEDFSFESNSEFPDSVASEETIKIDGSNKTHENDLEEESKPQDANDGFGIWERPLSIEAVYVDPLATAASTRTELDIQERSESIGAENPKTDD